MKQHSELPVELENANLRAKLDDANKEIAELLAMNRRLLALNEQLEAAVGEYAIKQMEAHNETLKEAVHYSGDVAQRKTKSRGNEYSSFAQTP